jgi:plasmid stabilization system protein ParE
MRRVLFTEAARADFADAVDWYNTHAAHVVPQFRESLRAAVARPYLLIFREAQEDCYVVAVFHVSRDPTAWRLRTK